MVEYLDVLTYIGGVIAFAMAFSIGANDVSNAVGAAVGSRAITLRQAIILAGIFEFAGSASMGHLVSNTIKQKIIDPNEYDGEMEVFVLGMFCALFASTLWVLLATLFSLPVSTTHTLVGGILGFGVVTKGIDAVHLGEMGLILLSWLVTPVVGGAIAFGMYFAIKRLILQRDEPLKRALWWLPFIVGLTLGILIFFIIATVLPLSGVNAPLWVPPIASLCVAIIVGVLAKFVLLPWLQRRLSTPDYEPLKKSNTAEPFGAASRTYEATVATDPNTITVDSEKGVNSEKNADTHQEQPVPPEERIFRVLMILTSVFIAFSHGANDVANAVGPFAVLLESYDTGTVATDKASVVPFWLVIGGAVGIVLGVAVLGYKVIKTVGEQIAQLNFPSGYSAQLGTATTVMLATYLGFPVSTTHTIVGSIAGMGLAKSGQSGLNMRTLLKILGGWVLTLLVGALGTIALFYAFEPGL